MNAPCDAVCFGELLWDCFPERRLLGGAPANVAVHLASLGLNAALVTGLGGDALGQEARAQIGERGVDLSALTLTPFTPTGTVQVTRNAQGSPQYEICSPAAWDFIAATPRAREACRTARAFVFGSLAQRASTSRVTLRELIQELPADCIRLLDVNLRAPFWTAEILAHSLPLCTVLKVSEEEWPEVARALALQETAAKAGTEALLHQYNLRAVLLTRGAEGAALLRNAEGNAAWLEQAPVPADVVDTVGAGDSFTAAMLASWLRGKTDAEALNLAVRVAAYVCSQPGATPPLPHELTAAFAS